MISPERIHQYPFFSGLNREQISIMAQIARSVTVAEDRYVFQEGSNSSHFGIIEQGTIDIITPLPDQNKMHQLWGKIIHQEMVEDVIVASIGPGEMYGWSAILPPHIAMATGKTETLCHLIEFDGNALRNIFNRDYQFGYLMMQKTAQFMRTSLRNAYFELWRYKR